ncbi:MAG: LytTR family transcriptional regulator [Flavobacteriales bacterium]|nr:LytTR family transcriptional regulator [Flavobacteriales bacterium]
MVIRTLKEFEDILDPEQFVRVHYSYLINVKHVKKYIRGEGGEGDQEATAPTSP